MAVVDSGVIEVRYTAQVVTSRDKKALGTEEHRLDNATVI